MPVIVIIIIPTVIAGEEELSYEVPRTTFSFHCEQNAFVAS